MKLKSKEEIRQIIDEAKLQVKEGKTQTHEQVNKEIEEWLNK